MKNLHDDFRAANSPDATPDQLKELSFNESDIVRASVLYNKATPVSAVEILFNDNSDIVKDALKMNGYPIGPEITQAKEVVGKSVILRNVEVSDAEYIISLRTDFKKGRFISSTSNDIKKQQEWIRSYLSGSGQAYFIITSKDGERYGTVRLYDKIDESFCWGSWVISNEAPPFVAMESALLTYKYALKLGFTSSHFDVRKGNLSVIKFHERFGAVRVGETDDDILFKIDKESILKSIEKYKRFTNDNVMISL